MVAAMPGMEAPVDEGQRVRQKRVSLEIRRAEMKAERSTFDAHWRDLDDFFSTIRSRFTRSRTNKGHKRRQFIINSTPGMAVRTFKSGLMATVTPPARPWFNVTTPTPELAEVGEVKDWLFQVNTAMNTVFLQSNLYGTLPVMYGDIGIFGTGAIYMQEDFDDVVRFFNLPVGSYCLGTDENGLVRVFTRDFRMTVRQIVEMFGRDRITGNIDWDNISTRTRSLWEKDHKEQWIDVVHTIEPNPQHDPNKFSAKFKRYSSTYYEDSVTSTRSTQIDDDKFLRESGLDFFPVLAARWEVAGEDVYATDSPGITALGDNRALQQMEKRKAQALEKKVMPPMKGPPELATASPSILPGDVTYVAEREGRGGFTPAHEINFQITELENEIRRHEERIDDSFHKKAFDAFLNTDRRVITATEVEEASREKLTQLTNLQNRLEEDLQDPLITNTFAIMIQRGLIPEPPEVLDGIELKVEYISVLAQAQKALGLAGIERWASSVTALAKETEKPELLDIPNWDEVVRRLGDANGVDPTMVNNEEDVETERVARAAALEAQRQAEMMAQGAAVAKDLSSADMSGDNALTRLSEAAEAA